MNPRPNDLVEVRDSEGGLVGHFTPVNTERAPLLAQTAARVDPAEIARRKAAHKTGRTTCEVFERLKSLTQDPALLAHLQEKIDGLKE